METIFSNIEFLITTLFYNTHTKNGVYNRKLLILFFLCYKLNLPLGEIYSNILFIESASFFVFQSKIDTQEKILLL